MCGISGIITTNGDMDGFALISRIVESQTPRGPDAKGVRSYRSDTFRLELGHNRLSIIDLSEKANQPMRDAEGDLHIVFNGEIYNYLELRAELETSGVRFVTKSDTEVILEAYSRWGIEAFERFIGMFAIALYNAAIGELLLIRDRFGVKPLYYWADASTLVFASTPTVIAAWAGLTPNLDYVARGIRYKYYDDDTDISPYYGLNALEPSHLLRIRVVEGTVITSKHRYYDFHARVAAVSDDIAGASEISLEQRVLDLLRSACRMRQRSDVPLGLSVSGGVDSATIAAILYESLNGITGYSYSHPEAPGSEGPLVAELAKHTRMQPRYVWLTRGQEIIDLFWRTLKAQDAPFPHVSIMAQHAVFQAAHRDGMKVLLGGQGGDEAFMGYRKYYLFYALSILRGGKITLLPQFVADILPLIPAIAKRVGVFFPERRRYMRVKEGMGTRLILPIPKTYKHMGLKGVDTSERQILDVTRFSLPSLLRYEDRNSMGNSVESRLPFLDQRVMEFGVALSERIKLRNGFGKWILRKSMIDKIPEKIRLNRDKRGFDVSQEQWIDMGLGHALRDALNERKAVVAQWLPKGASVNNLFSDVILGRHPQAFKEAVSLIWLVSRV